MEVPVITEEVVGILQEVLKDAEEVLELLRSF